MRILVSGFKPFLGGLINPSEHLTHQLKALYPEIESLILPVEFKKSFEFLDARIKSFAPDYLIMLGQASGRSKICLEKIALNWIQSEHRDESGVLPLSGKILGDQPLALMSAFPIDQIFLELKKKNLPIEISFSAGAYVCNELYFRVLNEHKELKAVFIHLPLFPEQLEEEDERPSLTLMHQFETLKALISNLN